MKTQTTYLLIGSGRLARHLDFYFSALFNEQPKGPSTYRLTRWSRRPVFESNSKVRLVEAAKEAQIILLAVSDQAIAEFAQREFFNGKVLCHFSGALHIPGMIGLHPLMTFGRELYEKDFYPRIPMVTSTEAPIQDIFPFLPNPIYRIEPRQKPLYHALCSMAANFPSAIWCETFRVFERDLQLPPDLLYPLIAQSLQNTLASGREALTGPLVRGDLSTMNAHLEALSPSPALRQLYVHFQEFFKSFAKETPHEHPAV